MKVFTCTIEEVLSRMIMVEAEDSDEALEKLQKAYDDELIVVDSPDDVCQDVRVDDDGTEIDENTARQDGCTYLTKDGQVLET